MKNDQTIPVSILTPVFNQSMFIGETIESVLSQNYDNLEYLVIDDGSTDNTLDIVKKYSDKLRWETQSNSGESATVNKGISLLSGVIVGIVNGDDPLLPGAVQTAVEKFIAQPELVCVYPDWKMIGLDGDLLEVRKTPEYGYANMLRGHDCLPGPGSFFKRDLFMKLNGRDTNFRYVADFEFWLRAGLEGPFTRIPQTLACHRWYEGGTSIFGRGQEMAKEHIRLVDKIYSLPNLPPSCQKFKYEAYSSASFTAGVCCGDNLILKKEYFKNAIKLAPFSYISKYRRRLFEMLLVFFPRIFAPIDRFLHKLKTR